MIRLIMAQGNRFMGAPFYFPTTPGEMGEYAARLENTDEDIGKIRVVAGTTPVEGLSDCLKSLELNSADDLTKLNILGIQISEMSETERWIFSGALETEPVNSLDDVLRISGSFEQYLLLPDVTHDRELGEYLVQRGLLGSCPENIRPYLDYVVIGSIFQEEHGGVYNLAGYVVRKENVPELVEEDSIELRRNEEIEEIVHLQLQTEKTKQRGEPYCLVLPADLSYLEWVCRYIGVDDLENAEVVSIEYCKLYLSDVMPTDLPTADDCNEFAKYVAEMLETDGEYLKFLSVLRVKQPEDFAEVLNIAADLDDYERVLEGTEEYGRYVLERIGMDDEMIDIVEGYMDLDEFGSDWMEEDGVRTTEFGSVRRISSPFEDAEFRQEMGGM